MASPSNRQRLARGSARSTNVVTLCGGVVLALLILVNASLFFSLNARTAAPSAATINAEPQRQVASAFKADAPETESAPTPTLPPPPTPTELRELGATPSVENWPMKEAFYTVNYSSSTDTSTTIIFNLYKGPAEALKMQLRAATRQQRVQPPEIWVMCFDSPLRQEYEQVVNEIKRDASVKSKIVLTVSDFNHKFHGRFLLAYMAKTKYVLLVDDDRNLDETTVTDYIAYMHKRPGVWGNKGHLRAATFNGYKAWPTKGYDLKHDDYVEMDYLSGMWFLEQSWLEYFVKERMPSWETAEDMHLAHVMRKYLNLNTYGGNVALGVKELPNKKHAATVGKALDLREYIFDHQLGRGNKVANVDQPIDTLVYAETPEQLLTVVDKIQACKTAGSTGAEPWCTLGKTAAVFRGAKEQDVVGLIDAAQQLCDATACEYLSVKPKIKHPIRYFNMREGFGQETTEVPWQTAASDVLLSFVGILNNILPERVVLPDVSHAVWVETRATNQQPQPRKKNRLQIYHETLQLAISIHTSQPTNQKWDHRDRELDPDAAYPSDLEVLIWKTTAS